MSDKNRKTIETRGVEIASKLARLQVEAVRFAVVADTKPMGDIGYRTEMLAEAAMQYAAAIRAACGSDK